MIYRQEIPKFAPCSVKALLAFLNDERARKDYPLIDFYTVRNDMQKVPREDLKFYVLNVIKLLITEQNFNTFTTQTLAHNCFGRIYGGRLSLSPIPNIVKRLKKDGIIESFKPSYGHWRLRVIDFDLLQETIKELESDK